MNSLLDLTLGQVLAMLILSNGAALVLGGIGYSRFRNGRQRNPTQDAFVQRVDEFIVHARHEHSAHQEALNKQTQILERVSETLAATRALLEARR